VVVVRRVRARWAAAVIAAAVVVTGCSGSSDDAGDDDDGQANETTEGSTGTAAVEGEATTTTLRADVVELDGSVEDVLSGIPEARRFAEGVADWLADVPGQEGVLRNRRGITLFVPADDGFSESDRDEAFADPDAAAATIGEHLRVGTLAELAGTITMASGAEYTIGADGTIGGRQVVRTETATNGVIHVLDGPLGGD